MDSQNSQIHLPLVEPKQGILIGAETLGQPCSACGLMEQAAQRSPNYGRSLVDPEPDDPTSALVHDDEAPIGFESKGLKPEEIEALKATLHVVPSINSSPLKNLNFLYIARLDEFLDHTGKGKTPALSRFQVKPFNLFVPA